MNRGQRTTLTLMTRSQGWPRPPYGTLSIPVKGIAVKIAPMRSVPMSGAHVRSALMMMTPFISIGSIPTGIPPDINMSKRSEKGLELPVKPVEPLPYDFGYRMPHPFG